MQLPKRLLRVGIACCAIIAIFSTSLATAQYPVFFVCLTNDTNIYVNYSTEWCTRAGYNCSGYRSWTIAPGDSRTHWGSPGNGRMDVTDSYRRRGRYLARLFLQWIGGLLRRVICTFAIMTGVS